MGTLVFCHNHKYEVCFGSERKNDYLVVYHNGPNLMKEPDYVYRAEDTRKQNIEKPDFVKNPRKGNPMYQYWEK